MPDRNLRKYGNKPFKIAVIHGGPGAAGEMAPVALKLSAVVGVLEPLQTATLLKGQVRELFTLLQRYADLPVILIGWSWGAWLSYIFTAKHPLLVKKLILVGSGPFEEKYTDDIMNMRLSRLDKEEETEFLSLMKRLSKPGGVNNNLLFARFGQLLTKADSYKLTDHRDEVIEYRHDIYFNVWQRAARLRKTGALLEMAKKILCPVVAIHGDFDPHPASGVRDPLSAILKDFRFIELEKCGHYPWLEKYARDKFYKIVFSEIK